MSPLQHANRRARTAIRVLASTMLAGLAGAVLAAPAQAEPVVGIAFQTLIDGTATFDGTDGPGRDTGPSNGEVRSYDTVQYAWTVNVNSSDGSTETFDRIVVEQTLPAGLSWRSSDVPLYCRGAGWEIDGQTLTCVYVPPGGTGTTGSTLNFVLTALAGGEPDGTVAPGPDATVTVSSGATTSPPATATADDVTIRSAPFLDMYKRSPVGRIATSGGPGYWIDYSVGIEIPESRRNTFGRRGFLMPTAPVTFTDDLSGVSAGAQWVSCTGALQCVPSGQSVAVTISSLPAEPPSNGANIASGTMRIFVPQADVDADPDGNLNTTNVITSLVANAPAAGGGTVPSEGDVLSNNTSTYNLITQGGAGNGTFGKRYMTATGGLLPTQMNYNDGNGQVRDGQVLLSEVRIGNSSQTAPVPTPAMCDVWDNTRIELSDEGPGPDAHGGSPVWLQSGGLVEGTDYVVEYGTEATATGDDATRWAELRSRSACDDGSDTWTTTRPSDLSTVTKVRIRMLRDLAPGEATAVWRINLQVSDPADGELIANFAGRGVGGTWSASTYNPTTNAGGSSGHGDRVRANGVTVGIRKRSIDPAVSFGSPVTILSGTPIQFELVPDVTALDIGTGPAVAQNVVIRDRLPAGLTYDADRPTTPGNLTPVVSSDAEGRQILTWTIPSMTAGEEPTITFWAEAATTAINQRVNEVIIDSEGDLGGLETFPASTPSSGEQHYSRQTINLQSAGGVRISKTALQAVVEPVDEIAFRIEYANLTPSTVSNVDIIEVLPFAGDGTAVNNVPGRNPATDLTGTMPIAAVEVTEGETIRYTDADPAEVYASSNPQTTNDALYGALPAGKSWCLPADFGTAGCPAELADATAIRIGRTSLTSGEVDTITLRFAPLGNASGDVYSNTAAIRYGTGNLGALSNVATTRVVASSIGDYVWEDRNRNGIQDAGEPGLKDVRVTLSGTDKHGRTISVQTRTDADGRYLFTASSQAAQDAGVLDLVSGSYQVTFHRDGLPVGTTFTTQNAAGSTPADGSDADPQTGIAAVTIPNPAPNGVDGEDLDVDAGVILGVPPKPDPEPEPEPQKPRPQQPEPKDPPRGGDPETPPSGGETPTPPPANGDEPDDDGDKKPPKRDKPKRPELTLVKKAADRTITAGDSITYTLEVRNRGRGAARDTVVCDRPGTGLVVGEVPDGARFRDGQLCWQLGTLKPGERQTVRVTMDTVRTLRRGRVVNRATVNGQRSAPQRDAAKVRVKPDEGAVAGVGGQSGVTG